MTEEPNNDFCGDAKPFGIDPRNVHHLEYIHELLKSILTCPSPLFCKTCFKWPEVC